MIYNTTKNALNLLRKFTPTLIEDRHWSAKSITPKIIAYI